MKNFSFLCKMYAHFLKTAMWKWLWRNEMWNPRLLLNILRFMIHSMQVSRLLCLTIWFNILNISSLTRRNLLHIGCQDNEAFLNCKCIDWQLSSKWNRDDFVQLISSRLRYIFVSFVFQSSFKWDKMRTANSRLT